MGETSLDDIDLEILRWLQNDSRMSFKDLANKLGVAVATAHNRVKRLKEEKIIKKHAAVVDPFKVGYDFMALILIAVKGGRLREVEEDISKFENVVYVLDITGQWDSAVIARFKDRNHLDRFVKELLSRDDIEHTYTSMVLNVVKEDFTVQI